jgi:putative inorganic carbon (HCO3(-)) transporter
VNDLPFKAYLLFTISWFLHLAARIPALGVIRFDLFLMGLLTVLLFRGTQNEKRESDGDRTGRILQVLAVYAVLTMPFVEWPGSVLRSGLENFFKAILFFFFTKQFVDSERKLRVFLFVFLSCQSFRVLEPVYLHLTEGYWGESAYAGGAWLERLAGAPHDIIGANGLAFVILTVMPFLYFLRALGRWCRLAFFAMTPVFLYALALTGSRSGLLGLGAVAVGILLKTKRKLLTALLMIGVLALSFSLLSGQRKDRFDSIFNPDTKNAATATGRIEGVKSDFRVALRRPLFGHGLGTSKEANFHFGNSTHLAHDLYAEVAQELGFVGLFIFLLFMKSIIANFSRAQNAMKVRAAKHKFSLELNAAMQVWLGMNILFSFASYGLSSYEWYLFGGLSVVIRRLATRNADSDIT